MEIKDFQIAIEELGNRFESSPFLEIWLYTGFYSSNDGNEAEYSLVPLKVSDLQEQTLSKLAK